MLTISSIQPEFFPAADNLFQSFFWGSFKEVLGQKALYFRVAFDDENGNPQAYPFLVLLRKIKGFYCEEYSYFEKLFDLNRDFLQKKETQNFDSGVVPLDAQVPPSNDSDSPMAGLYIFKTGFGGAVTHFAGAWNFLYNIEEYQSFSVNEALLLR